MSDQADIDMVASVTQSTELHNAQARAIASLSEKLHLPLSEVRQAYLNELARLNSRARIRGFVDALALRSTRAVLRLRSAARARDS